MYSRIKHQGKHSQADNRLILALSIKGNVLGIPPCLNPIVHDKTRVSSIPENHTIDANPYTYVSMYMIMLCYVVLYRLKSPASRIFTQPFIQGSDQRNIRAPRHWPLWGEFTGHRWIPHTKDQLRGKCFPWMASSCITQVWKYQKSLYKL